MTSTLQRRNRIAKIFRQVGKAVGLTVVLALVTTQMAQAQTYTVLHTFRGPDGSGPTYAGLVGDAAGNLYGTTPNGGDFSCDPPYGCGTVFQISPTGKRRVLHIFAGGLDGSVPAAGLVRDSAGNLYGTTNQGGGFYSKGTVFKVDKTGTETVLYAFTALTDGAFPAGALVRDSAGNLYGTTAAGGGDHTCGLGGCGTVFKLDAAGAETVLHRFNGLDGAHPVSGLIRDSAGNFYGTTYDGGDPACNYPYGYGCGKVFMLDPAGNETVLYSFVGGTDGAGSLSGLVRDAAGNLYGTTEYGGGANPTCGDNGCGTVFKVTSTGLETVLHAFTGASDGIFPNGSLVRDSAGNLYGTTYTGGVSGYGLVFKLDAAGAETVLYQFIGGADGSFPYTGLVRDPSGNFYGTTWQGGDLGCSHPVGCGTVFKLVP